MLIPIAEIARSHGGGGTPRVRGRARRRLLMRFLITCAAVTALGLSPGIALALPTGGQVVAGAGTIATSGSTTTISQASQHLSINWKGFDVASGETVDFNQPGATAIAVNRIFGNTGSRILGHLNANGQVYLINPSGVIFGRSAVVNVGGLVASTLNFSDSDLDGNTRNFSDAGSGSVVNKGTITAATGGSVALLGHTVENDGTITARLGTVALAAGDAMTLTFAGSRLVNLAVTGSTLNDLVENDKLIVADGGTVLMTAGAKDALLASVVNNTGIVQAQTVENHDGTITLLGGMQAGTVNVGGTLDASAPNGGNGGKIETSGAHVQIGRATITAGPGGQWLVDPVDLTIDSAAATTIEGSLNSGTSVTEETTDSNASGSGTTNSGPGDINVDAAIGWTGNNSTLTLSAFHSLNINAAITAGGSNDGLALTTNNGIGGTSSGGTLNINAPVTLSGTAPSLSINFAAYTVVQSMTALQNINSGLNGHYALGEDLTDTTTTGSGFTPIGSNNTNAFTGTFDGLGHTITGLYINRPTTSNVGLFGDVNGGTIRNIGLAGDTVTGGNTVGGLVGNNNGTISNAYATGSVSGSVNVGGLVGANGHGTISLAYATGSVSGKSFVGGLVGWNVGTITDAYATGSVSGSVDVGGLVGSNDGTITDAYATGSVSGSNYVGGLVGGNYSNSIVSNAYATGSVSGTSNVGGLVGFNIPSGTVSKSYWDTTTTGHTNGYGSNTGTWNASNQGLTTANALQASSYGNFGTSSNLTATGSTGTWFMVDGESRPFLRFEWSGTITNAHQLQLMAMKPTASYTLANDIDLTAHFENKSDMWATDSGTSTGSGFTPVGNTTTNFTGTFDGLGHTITGLYINRPGTNYVGLFGDVNGGTIRNIGLVGGSVSGGSIVGGLVGSNSNSTVSNAYATGSVSGNSNVGGLVGWNDGTITDAYATGSVNGIGSSVGGLVGVNFSGTITDAYATGSVSGVGSVGGLVGQNFGTVSKSYWDMTTTGHTNGYGSNTGTWNASNQGLTTANALSASSYANFGTSTNLTATGSTGTWFMVDGETRPFLRFEWSGTITNAHQLQLMAMKPNASYTLANDLDLTAHFENKSDMWATDTTAGSNVGSGFAPVGSKAFPAAFTGSFDGSNHTITGLYINRTGESYIGLFNRIGTNGTVRNVGLVGGSVSGMYSVGELVGSNDLGTISNAYATGRVSGTSNIGGLVGLNSNGTITDAYATGSVNGSNYVGGLVGLNCNHGTITDAYATGSVSGSSSFNGVGGLVGNNSNGTITDTYATGSVTGSYNVGGLVGVNFGTISNSFYDTATTGQSSGIAGPADIAGTVYGMTSAQMQNPANFVVATPANGNVNPNWDFRTVWGAESGVNNGYPILRALNTTLPTLLVVSVPDKTMTYGGSAPALSITSSNYVYGGSNAGDVSSIGWGSAVSSTTHAGTYNYATSNMFAVTYNTTGAEVAFTSNSLTVNPATLTATLTNAGVSKTYDGTTAAPSGFAPSWNITGFVNNDKGATLTSTNAAYNSAHVAGANTLTISGIAISGISGPGTSLSTDYTLSATSASVGASITPAILTYTANPASMTYGGTVPSLSGSVSGFVNGETQASATTGTASFTTTAGSTNNVGSYAIDGSGLTANNGDYTFVQAGGNATALTVTPAPLTVTAGNASKTYGQTPTLTAFTSSGLQNKETIGSVTETSAGASATASVSGGPYTITPSGATGGTFNANDYTITYATGQLTVNPAPLTITADNQTMTYGGSLPTLTASYSGFVNGDTSASLTTQPTLSSGTPATADAGTYTGTLTASGAVDSNYTIGYVPGTLTIDKAAITSVTGITAAGKIYDGTVSATLNTGGAGFTGIISGDNLTVATATGAFANKNAGTNKTVDVTGITLGGTDAGNYTLDNGTATTTADITPAQLTVSGVLAENKAYDGTTADNLDTADATFGGMISGDSVSLGSGNGTGTFAQKKVGFNIPVTADLSLAGTDAGNYTLFQPTGLAASILPNLLTGSRSPAGWIESFLLGTGWQAAAPFGINRYPNGPGHHDTGWIQSFLLSKGWQAAAPGNIAGYPNGLVHYYNGRSILNLIGGGMLQP